MTWGTISAWETLLFMAAVVALVTHARGLRASLADQRKLRADGVNGACALLVRGHIRGHALRLVANGVVTGLALYLMTRAAPAADRTAPIVVRTLLVFRRGIVIVVEYFYQFFVGKF
jgi:hypothetical protein